MNMASAFEPRPAVVGKDGPSLGGDPVGHEQRERVPWWRRTADQPEGSLTGAVRDDLDPEREDPVVDRDIEHALRLARVLCTAILRWANGRGDPDRKERRQRSIDGLGEEVAPSGSLSGSFGIRVCRNTE